MPNTKKDLIAFIERQIRHAKEEAARHRMLYEKNVSPEYNKVYTTAHNFQVIALDAVLGEVKKLPDDPKIVVAAILTSATGRAYKHVFDSHERLHLFAGDQGFTVNSERLMTFEEAKAAGFGY